MELQLPVALEHRADPLEKAGVGVEPGDLVLVLVGHAACAGCVRRPPSARRCPARAPPRPCAPARPARDSARRRPRSGSRSDRRRGAAITSSRLATGGAGLESRRAVSPAPRRPARSSPARRPHWKAARLSATAAPLSSIASRIAASPRRHQASLPGVAEHEHVGGDGIAHQRGGEPAGVEETRRRRRRPRRRSGPPSPGSGTRGRGSGRGRRSAPARRPCARTRWSRTSRC